MCIVGILEIIVSLEALELALLLAGMNDNVGPGDSLSFII